MFFYVNRIYSNKFNLIKNNIVIQNAYIIFKICISAIISIKNTFFYYLYTPGFLRISKEFIL